MRAARVSESFSVFARGSLYDFKTQCKTGTIIQTPPDQGGKLISSTSTSASDSTTSPAFGIGLSYAVNRVASLRLEYERLGRLTKSLDDNLDNAHVFSIGLVMKF